LVVEDLIKPLILTRGRLTNIKSKTGSMPFDFDFAARSVWFGFTGRFWSVFTGFIRE